MAGREERIRILASRTPLIVWAAAIAVLLLAVYGRGFVVYDTMYALIWGSELRSGALPDFDVPNAPSPHPLANAVGAVLSLLGHDAIGAAEAIVMLSYGYLALGAFVLGRSLFSWPVGVVFALILVSRPFLLGQGLRTTIDIPYLALLCWAAVFEVRNPRNGWRVLALLGLAGLLKPEAWILAGAYWLYLTPALERRELVQLAVLVAVPPVLWLGFDLLATGDLLHSGEQVRGGGGGPGAGTSVQTALDRLPVYMELILSESVALVGFGGALAMLIAFPQKAWMPVAAAALSVAGFVALDLFEIPVLPRYVLLPAVVLAFGASVATFGWLSVERSSRVRLPWLVASLAVLALVAAEVWRGADEVRDYYYFEARRASELDLSALAVDPRVEAAHDRCPLPTYVQNFRLVPPLAYAMGLPTTRFKPAEEKPRMGLAFVARMQLASDVYQTREDVRVSLAPPRGFRLVAANASWALYARC